jgi:hypothetical protein
MLYTLVKHGTLSSDTNNPTDPAWATKADPSAIFRKHKTGIWMLAAQLLDEGCSTPDGPILNATVRLCLVSATAPTARAKSVTHAGGGRL